MLIALGMAGTAPDAGGKHMLTAGIKGFIGKSPCMSLPSEYACPRYQNMMPPNPVCESPFGLSSHGPKYAADNNTHVLLRLLECSVCSSDVCRS